MKDLVLDRMPVALGPSDYAVAATSVEAKLAALPGAVAVYAIGSVSAPGISDLDRIVVVPAGSPPLPSVWPYLSPRARAVAMHTPFIVDVETFRAHRLFAHLEPLHLVWGEDLPLEDAPSPTATRRTGLESLLTLRLGLARNTFLGRVRVRSFLCELHNLRHSLRLLGLSPREASAAWQVASDVEALRASWWEASPAERVERITTLHRDATAAVDRALDAAAPDDRGGRSGDISLCAPWTNVSLTAMASRSGRPGAWIPCRAAGWSARVSERRWRWARHLQHVPRRILAELSDTASGDLAHRADVVRRYMALTAQHRGWSQIGFARAFTSP